MKRIFAGALVLFFCFAILTVVSLSTANAESVTQAVNTSAFDATGIVTGVIVLIGAALAAVLSWLTYKYLVPLLKVPILGTIAKWAVDLAEEAFGRGNGDAKFDSAAAFVSQLLAKIHLKVDQTAIRAAIISAWTALNLGQIAAGIKASAVQAVAADSPKTE